MTTRIASRLALMLLATLAVLPAARAAIWGEHDALNAIQDTSEQIKYLTGDEGLTGGQGLATEPLPSSNILTGGTSAIGDSSAQTDQPMSGSMCDCEFDDGCDDCCSRSCWTVWAGAIFLHRSHADVLAVGNTGNPSNYYFNTPAGPDLNAIRRGDVFDLDFRYFNVFHMLGGQGLALAPNDFTFGAFTSPGAFATSSYTSSLQSVELNLRRDVTPNITVLGGFRYLSLREDFGVNFDPFNVGLFSTHLNGINRLYGVQGGAYITLLRWGFFDLQSAFKGGIYGNNAMGALRVNEFNTFQQSVSSSAHTTSFVGDISFTGVFNLNDTWAIRAGYQLLWITNLALAANQVPTGPLLNVNTSGDAFFNGALVSLQASF